MTTGQSRLIAGSGLLVVVVAGLYLFNRVSSRITIHSPPAPNTTYEECVRAGYPVQGDNPRTCTPPEGYVFTRTSSMATSTGSSTVSVTPPYEIQITDISIHQRIASPLTVNGSARGAWYFEGSFPVILVDGNGKIIAQAPAKATSDWMTSNAVPFSVTLAFVKPGTATGTLIFKNDNPSGLPQKAASYTIPVRF